jgi:hypothetical protein
MFTDSNVPVGRKRMSFLSVAAISLTAVCITFLFCGTGLALYGMKLLDKKSESLAGLICQAAAKLPEFREALPPALADAIDDERLPDYRENLVVSARIAKSDDGRGARRAVISVENRGDRVISLLSLRLVGLDETGDPVFEQEAWAATPLQIDDDWRGPLQPHETRLFPVYWYRNSQPAGVDVEVTDLRVWRGSAAPSTSQSESPVAAEENHSAEP